MVPGTWLKTCLLLVIAITIGCGPSQFVKDGDSYFAKGDYRQAVASYEAALAEDPKSEETQRKAQLAREQWFQSLVLKSQQAKERGDFIGALRSGRQAFDLLPEDRRSTQLLADLDQTVTYKAQEFRDAKDFSTAIMLHEVALQELPGPHTHAEDARRVKMEWQEELAAQATRAEAAGHLGESLLIWGKLAQLSSDPQHSERRVDLLARLQEVLAFRVVLEPEGDPGSKTIASGLSEVSVGTLQVSPPAKGEADVRIKFEVSPTTLQDSVSQSWRSVTYQSGTQQVPNPFYESRLRDLEREERRLMDAENEVTRKENSVTDYEERVSREEPEVSSSTRSGLQSARNSLQSARDRVVSARKDVMRAREALNREPQTKEEPVYSSHEYAVETHVRQANATLSLRILGLKKDDIEVPLGVSASDETHGSQPSMTGVGADPLVLPSKAQLTAILVDDAMNQLMKEMLVIFDTWRGSILTQAARELDEGKRVDLLVQYLVVDLERPDGQVSAEIKALRGIPDALNAITGR